MSEVKEEVVAEVVETLGGKAPEWKLSWDLTLDIIYFLEISVSTFIGSQCSERVFHHNATQYVLPNLWILFTKPFRNI